MTQKGEGRRGCGFLFLLLILLTLSPAAENRADFLVVADPAGLALFDAAKSPVTPADRARFLPGSPFQVLDAQTTLGGELDSALKFSFNGAAYYISKAGNGAFVGSRSKENIKSYKNCVLLNDTVRVLRAGDLLIRLFSVNGQTYVKRIGPAPAYGFSALSAGMFEPVRAAVIAPSAAVISPAELRNIEERLRAANESYRAFFGHLGRLTGQDRVPPEWTWTQQEGRLLCTLKGPRLYAHQLKESTRYVVRDLENIFIGKAVDVVLRDNEISVSPRETGEQP